MSVCGLGSVALFLLAATGVGGFSVTSSNPDVRVKENVGTDLSCSYSGDFGANARVEWKFKDLKGSQVYVIFDGKPTGPYANRVTMYNSNLRFTTTTRRDNGVYDCEVSGSGQFGEVRVKLTVLVPPTPPLCRIPTSVTTGKKTTLTCHDANGSPPPKYRWYKNNVLLPPEPSKIAGFKNATYRINVDNGNLEYTKTAKTDSGQYYCEAVNEAGPPQRCKGGKMEIRDLNTGGIVAGVIVALLLVALLIFGLWYANKKGYLPKKSESKPKPSVVYQPTSLNGGDEDDGEFKQKSSFVV
ncbi:F11 receptor, tandem duplicate 1 [Notolabrus celidotus]|uniref:F11 receptor, tandem duplicate 1 n=1 Tax=Notolabrus celidotus TaxID=1203425 RepID=UPI00148FBD3E|nr:F11 receptor, tandem duplicate 1 [Notolabrus celidotus]XP_034540105.1 F11 receptor, tandem duplicate 1 [Notolabrus celidotus]